MRVPSYIWRDELLVDLSPEAKLVHLCLITADGISLAGIVAFTPARWATLTGLTLDEVNTAIGELAEARKIAVDTETAEVVCRDAWRFNIGHGDPQYPPLSMLQGVISQRVRAAARGRE